MAIEFDEKDNVTSTTEDGVISVKLYSMQNQIDDLRETIKILRAREQTFNNLCKLYREEMERLNNIINKFEEDLKRQREICLSLNEKFAICKINRLIDKLQELKGSNSNENL